MEEEPEIKNKDVKILLVDNKTQEIKFLKILLEQHNYQASIAPDGFTALQRLYTDKPHIIISDVKMPEMNGYDFCWKIKNNQELKDIPVILLTQVSGHKDILKGLESGVDNFIFKPYNNKHLLTRLHDMLMSKKLRQRNPENDKVDVFFLGENYSVTLNKVQVLDLLFSVLENTLKKNEELEYVMNRLMVAMDNIRNLDELKNNFISSVSHEIRTPLTSISGSLRLIQGGICGPIPGKAINLLDIAGRNLDRLLLLLNDILDIQRIESGRMPFNFQHHSLLPLISNAIEANALLAEKYKIKVHLAQEAEDCFVNVDPDRFIQVLINLLSNAIKFSPEATTVYVQTKKMESNVRVSVKDDGPGIPDKYRTTIYDRFTQTSLTNNKQREGTGLGLNIAKEIIEKLNGSIDFISREGEGTIFFVELPIVDK